LRVRGLIVLSVLLLTGCAPVVSESSINQVEQGLPLLNQVINWSDCESGFECAVIAAPLDWTTETGEFVEIALTRKAAAKDLPPLLVNPGGPGVSGVKWLQEGYESIGTSALRSKFQLLGFDPRGTGGSSPVECLDADLKDQVYYGQSEFAYGSEADLDWSMKLLREFAQSCQEVGFDTGYFTTQQAARDLELIRVLMGMEQLDYLGYSYGTELGSVYAALFPDRVGRMVLDGAIDPTTSEGKNLIGQIAGFDNALRGYLADCLTQQGCPFSGTVDQGIAKIGSFLTDRESFTLPTQVDRELGIGPAISGIIAALYSQESWSFLSQAFTEAFGGDGTTMLLLADFYNDRNVTGGYFSNVNEANLAISCADSRITENQVAELEPQIEQASKVFGKYFSAPHIACESWPDGIGKQELDFGIPLANAPLVVGTTGDPATPYSQAVALAKLLDGATLLTFVGEGHTAYGGNECVDALVDAYFDGQIYTQEKLSCG
jgi:pimeloyl-ACP methyl ester carboxylesterase